MRRAFEIIGDVELFVRERAAQAPDAPFIAITGTNGKSTTTALIAHVLKAPGRDTQLGGNIGTAVLTLDAPAPDKFYVVECSSYQIDLAPSLNPSAGILLNLTPDHLDRHGDMQHYAAVKERLVAGSDVADHRRGRRAIAPRSPTGWKRPAGRSSAFPSDSRLTTAVLPMAPKLMEANGRQAAQSLPILPASARCAASTMRRTRWRLLRRCRAVGLEL